MPSRRHGLKAVFVTHSPAHRAAVSSDVRAGGASGAFDMPPSPYLVAVQWRGRTDLEGGPGKKSLFREVWAQTPLSLHSPAPKMMVLKFPKAPRGV